MASKANHTSTPESPRIFQHPRPISEVKAGVRKVPNLIVAQGIPLLKYPGPTPVLVNRVLKEKIQWGIRKWEQHKDLEKRIQIAEWEDEWDGILAKQEAVVEDDGELDLGSREEQQRHRPKLIRFYDPQATRSDNASTQQTIRRISWTTHLNEVDLAIQHAVFERGKKYATLGTRYWHEVVVPERELKEKERRAKKHARRMARKQAGSIFGGEGKKAEQKGQDVEPSSIASGFL